MADHVFAYEATAGKGALSWDLEGALAPLNLPSLAPKALVFSDLEQLISAVVAEAKSGDHILVMSNGGFGGIHQKILECLA